MVGISGGEARTSELTVDADIVMGAYNITLGAGQTVDGKDVSGLIVEIDYDSNNSPQYAVKEVSDDLRHSHDAEATNTAAALTVMKTITLTHGIRGTLRTKFDMKREAANSARAQIYKNGEAIGTLQSHNTGTYITKSQDIDFGEMVAGDTIELWGYKYIATTVYVQNFRLYYTDVATPVAVASSNS